MEGETTMVEQPVKKEVKTEKQPSKRILSIDRLRGFCIFMVVISMGLDLFGKTFEPWAPWFAHMRDGGYQLIPGISFADIFAATFIFVIGLTFVQSFKSREAKYGTKKAFYQTAMRYLGLIGLGCILDGLTDGFEDIAKGVKFVELDKNMQVCMIGLFVLAAFSIVLIVSRFVKNEKFKKIAEELVRYTLAIVGVFGLFFILVSTGEKINEMADKGNPEVYGGWIWDTLQNIGLAGLIALPFVKFDKWGKLAMVLVTLGTMTVFYHHGGYWAAEKILEGGIFGGLMWGCILLMGSVLYELKDDKSYWVITSLMLLFAVIMIVGFNVVADKRGCTPVYAMFTISISAMVWAFFRLFDKYSFGKFDFLSWWGGSSLLTYSVSWIFQFIAGTILATYGKDFIAPVWGGVVYILITLILLSVLNWFLSYKKVHVKL